MVPPRGKIFIGSGDFTATGEAIRDQLVTLAGLKPSHRVLDVGCGMGRVAVPLTAYLDEQGSYEGFDIVPSAIRWCRKKITARYSRFRFMHVDLKNDLYNLRTAREAKDFIFPYGDGEFDLVFLTSVFTHMVPGDLQNYLVQIHRVLKPGGTCFCTFFLLNREAEEWMERSGRNMFTTRLEHHALFHPRVREANVAYEEAHLLHEMIGKTGFEIREVHHGFWPGRPRSPLNNYQDICVFRKN
jgi:ubiquinone/menaquinone biosynthesis C-methylase UbiE